MIAKNIVKNNSSSTDDEFYGTWIKGYASYEYVMFARQMEDRLFTARMTNNQTFVNFYRI